MVALDAERLLVLDLLFHLVHARAPLAAAQVRDVGVPVTLPLIGVRAARAAPLPLVLRPQSSLRPVEVCPAVRAAQEVRMRDAPLRTQLQIMSQPLVDPDASPRASHCMRPCRFTAITATLSAS